MPHRNLHVPHDSVPYETFAALPEPETLAPPSLVRDARAAAVLEQTPDERVLAIAPEGVATAYRLAAEPLAVLRIGALPATARRELADRVDGDLADYDVLAWGSAPERENCSLEEFV